VYNDIKTLLFVWTILTEQDLSNNILVSRVIIKTQEMFRWRGWNLRKFL